MVERHRTGKARAARVESDYAARKAEIRDRARDIFLRYGYRKTTTEDIGKACGLGKAALYYYFRSKEEILADVVRTETEKVLARVREAVAASDDPKVQLVAMLRTSIDEVSRLAGDLVENKNASELMHTLPLTAEIQRHFLDEEVKILQRILEEGSRRGIFKKLTSPYIPHVIISGLRGLMFHLVETPNSPSMEDASNALLDLMLEGMCR